MKSQNSIFWNFSKMTSDEYENALDALEGK